MALGDSYATPEELAVRTGSEVDESFQDLLETASRMVEKFTGRQFNKAAEEDYPTERRFRALDPERLPVDDFHTLDDLVVMVDDVAWTVGVDFEPRPFDGVVNGQGGWPYFDLLTIGRYWPVGRRRATIEVAAHWGWAEVPTAIVEATLRLAGSMWDSISGESSVIKSETISGYSVSYQLPDLATTFNVPPELMPAVPYRRRRFGVA